ncbi:hypothetical protein VPH35_118049 [Triticum aestivum]
MASNSAASAPPCPFPSAARAAQTRARCRQEAVAPPSPSPRLCIHAPDRTPRPSAGRLRSSSPPRRVARRIRVAGPSPESRQVPLLALGLLCLTVARPSLALTSPTSLPAAFASSFGLTSRPRSARPPICFPLGLLAQPSVSFRSCEDSFDYVRLSSSWTRSSSLRDLRQDDHTLEITSIFACLLFVLSLCRATYHLLYHASHIAMSSL